MPTVPALATAPATPPATDPELLREPVRVRLTAGDLDRLDRYRHALGLGRATAVRLLLAQALDRLEVA